jgi:GNAT superfamily N-acetyltransferase
MMQIRPYEASDSAGVVNLSLRAWAPVFASIEQTLSPEVYSAFYPDWRIDQRRAVEAACADESIEVWIAEADELVVGFCAARLLPDSLGEIYMLAVDPDYQRQGIATALSERAVDWMRSVGVSVAMVETGGDPGHAPARQAYEKLGFQLFPVARYFKKL